MPKTDSGYAPINNARIYHETAGDGLPFVMIHAGVADSRMWNNEFAHFAERCCVLRYDQRGYGKSEPAEGEFSHLSNLTALLDHLGFDEPLILMGCSMGGGLAMDFALAHPARVRALIMVGSGPSGLKLDVPPSPLFKEIEEAWDKGDLERVCELETRIWFDGDGRTPDQVDPAMRALANEMNLTALKYEKKELGKRLPDAEVPAAGRLGELNIPVLIVVGEHDTPFARAAADYMTEHIPSARKALMQDAAHLPNMDHPTEFQRIVGEFLDQVGA